MWDYYTVMSTGEWIRNAPVTGKVLAMATDWWGSGERKTSLPSSLRKPWHIWKVVLDGPDLKIFTRELNPNSVAPEAIMAVYTRQPCP